MENVKQRKIKPRPIVRSGAVCDPLWALWVKHGSPTASTADYVPFQNTESYKYAPIEWRDEWNGE